MQRFTNGNGSSRDIYINIFEDFINFYYADNYQRIKERLKWMEETQQEITEEDREYHPFYSILVKYWISDATERLDRIDNFHTHMKQKTWFTQEMYNYINSQTLKNNQ